MSETSLQALAGLAMLYAGGELLVRGASALALRLGISQLAIGLTVVAFGTSAPELVVSLDAAFAGANDVSVGNVVGSNIANVALILGVASLIRPATVEAKVVRIDAPIMVVVSLALVAVLANGTVARVEGSILVACLVVYMTWTFRQARRESAAVRRELAAAAPEPPTASAPTAAAFAVGGFGLLIAGGHVLVGAAVTLAARLGLSEAVIGLTVVAVGTSLPELSTSVVASLQRRGDIAVGNVVGSNIFNVLGILGITAVLRPLARGGISTTDLGTMLLLAVVATLTLLTRGRLGRVEGAVLVAVYLGYTGWLLTA